MAEFLIVRIVALRALVTLTATVLLLAMLISDVWADGSQPDAEANFTLYPASVDEEVEEFSSERVDGLLHVLMKDDGSLAGYVTEALQWRLAVEVAGGQAAGLEDGYFTVRPKGSPLTEDCGGDAFCPAGFSAAGSSNLIEFEAPQKAVTAKGEAYFRRAFTLAMPLDLTWVGFYGDFHNRVERACMAAKEAVEASSRDGDGALAMPLSADLGGYGLAATAFRNSGFWAETDLVIAVKCWPSGHAMETLKARLNPKGR